MSEVECEYKDKCTSYPACCVSCQRNRAKQNYYIPVPYPPVILHPWGITITGTATNYYRSNQMTGCTFG